MNFKEALALAQKSEKLIGKSFNGSRVDDILIVPTNTEQRNNFIKEYLNSLDAHSAILPYMSCDVTVEALFNRDMICSTGAYLFCDVSQLQRTNEE